MSFSIQCFFAINILEINLDIWILYPISWTHRHTHFVNFLNRIWYSDIHVHVHIHTGIKLHSVIVAEEHHTSEAENNNNNDERSRKHSKFPNKYLNWFHTNHYFCWLVCLHSACFFVVPFFFIRVCLCVCYHLFLPSQWHFLRFFVCSNFFFNSDACISDLIPIKYSSTIESLPAFPLLLSFVRAQCAQINSKSWFDTIIHVIKLYININSFSRALNLFLFKCDEGVAGRAVARKLAFVSCCQMLVWCTMQTLLFFHFSISHSLSFIPLHSRSLKLLSLPFLFWISTKKWFCHYCHHHR